MTRYCTGVRVLWYWAPPFLWAAAILWASGDSFSTGATGGWMERVLGPALAPAANITIRKLAHLIEYAILALLVWRAIEAELKHPERRRLTLIVTPMLATLAVAVTDEVLQGLSRTRSGSLWDVLLDVTGGALALAIVTRLSRRRRMHSGSPAR
ncbi:MAG TPA: VanZ family protein [Thermoanaerobaculia bacterium]